MSRQAPALRRAARTARPRAPVTLLATCLLVLLLAGCGSTATAQTDPAVRLSAHSSAVERLEYVFPNHVIEIYDIDHANRLVGHISLPQLFGVRGVAADPTTRMLYISYGGQGGTDGSGSMLAYDLLTGKVVWQRNYTTGVDSIALTPNGRTIYVPVGEQSGSGVWEVVRAATGRVIGALHAGAGAHNTVIGLNGRFVYLAGVKRPYIAVASTLTNRIVKEIGPLKTGGRPFVINRSQTLAFSTAEDFLGFQVSSITTGKVLYNVAVPGFSYDPHTYLSSPSHGIALSPDQRRIYLIDTVNGYVHVFDISGVPQRRPRLIGSVRLAHPPSSNGWLQLSVNGRYLYVDYSGDVIDTKTLKLVDYLPPLNASEKSIEIDWRLGRPVAATVLGNA